MFMSWHQLNHKKWTTTTKTNNRSKNNDNNKSVCGSPSVCIHIQLIEILRLLPIVTTRVNRYRFTYWHQGMGPGHAKPTTGLPHSVMYDKELAATFHMESDSRVCTLQCRHNEHDGVSNHRRLDCLLKRLVRRRSKKTSKLHVTGLCVGNPPPVTSGFPHKGPVTRKIFPFGDVIMAMHDRMRKLIIGFSYSIC